MVCNGPVSVGGCSAPATRTLPLPTSGSGGSASPVGEIEAGGLDALRRSFEDRGVPPELAEFLLSAWRPGTRRQYGYALRKWLDFCVRGGVNPISPDVMAVLTFLHEQFRPKDSGLSGPGYSALNTIRSAISSIASIDGKPAGQHALVKIFMRAVFKERPALPRYSALWNPDVVLTFLKNLGSNKRLDNRLLAGKLLMLMLLQSGQRIQTMHVLDVLDMDLSAEAAVFRIRSLLKTSRPGHHLSEVTFTAYRPDSRLCVLKSLRAYLKRTLLDRGAVSQLFLTTRSPVTAASRDTLRNWTKRIMSMAGIDLRKFGPGSTRGASTSKAALRVSSDDIVKSVGWSTHSVFAKFYKRPLLPVNEFADAVLH